MGVFLYKVLEITPATEVTTTVMQIKWKYSLKSVSLAKLTNDVM